MSTITKGSGVSVSLEAKSEADKAIGLIKYHSGEAPNLKEFYSRLIEISCKHSEVIEKTVNSFLNQTK